MRLGVTSNVFSDETMAACADRLADFGVGTIELSVDTGFRLVELDDLLDAERRSELTKLLRRHGLDVSALSNHRDGQLVLGPHHEVTDGLYRGTAEEKRRYGVQRMKDTARAAAAIGVDVVTGFVGCPDYSRWFHWPGQRGWDVHYEALAEAWTDILGVYREYGIKFALELHPKQVVYEPVGARRSLEIFGEFAEWGFNFDPGNLSLAGVDSVEFIREFGGRIWYVHAKDVEHARPVTRDHFIAYPQYGEIGRNLRFRVPGWGDLSWRTILTELHLVGYDGVIAVENEDPTMGRSEGMRRGVEFLAPLLLETEREPRWW